MGLSSIYRNKQRPMKMRVKARILWGLQKKNRGYKLAKRWKMYDYL